MSCLENNNEKRTQNCGCIKEILEIILKLQDCTNECEILNNSCDRPFLGPSPSLICFNTRPVRLFRCLDAQSWTLPYTFNDTSGTSDIFRAESIDGCCLTCRILIPNPDTTTQASPYIATESFFTINLDCIGAISCLTDAFVPNL